MLANVREDIAVDEAAGHTEEECLSGQRESERKSFQPGGKAQKKKSLS